jgi:shikimate kinase
VTVVVIGPPAAGKSRVGKRLARRLGLPFIDTDARIVAEHGPIPALFAAHGEEHFRVIERQAVVDALAQDAVISLGGGAVLDPGTQLDLTGMNVVLLTVQPAAVAARITNGKRPLVRDLESWKALVEARTPLYASLANYTTDTSHRPIDSIVAEIAAWLKEQQ